MTTVQSARRALFVLLLASLLLVVWVFKPLGVALFLAAVFAGALWPVQRWLTSALRGRGRVAAVLLTIGVVVVILAPLAALSTFIIKESIEGVNFVTQTVQRHGVDGLVKHLPDGLEKLARQGLERVESSGGAVMQDLQSRLGAQSGRAAAVAGAVLASTGALLFQGAMMLIALYFFLTEKDRILKWIDDASPLAVGQTRELMREFRSVSGAVLRSSVLTAGVQALAALGGYFLTKVPYPLFFGALTFFVALIPAVGAASVCLFTAGILLLGGHTGAAAFLAGWGVLVVGLSDNLVKPLLMRHDVEMHGAVLFFALLGGLAAFGTIGLLLGPLAVAFFISLLRIYRRDYSTKGSDGGTPIIAGTAHEPPTRPARVLIPRDVET